MLSAAWLCLAGFFSRWQCSVAGISWLSTLINFPAGTDGYFTGTAPLSREGEQPYTQQKPFILVILFHVVRYTRFCYPWPPTLVPKSFQKIVRRYVCWKKTTQPAVVFTYPLGCTLMYLARTHYIINEPLKAHQDA